MHPKKGARKGGRRNTRKVGKKGRVIIPGSSKPVNVLFRWADPPATRFATSTYSSFAYNMSSMSVLRNAGSSTDIDYIGGTQNDFQKYKAFRVDHDDITINFANNEAVPCDVVVFPDNVVNTVNNSPEFAYAMALPRARHFSLTALTGSASRKTLHLKCSPARIATDPIQYRTQDEYSGVLLNGVPNLDPATMTYWIVAVAYPTISTTLGLTISALFKRKCHLFGVDMNSEIALSLLTQSNNERKERELDLLEVSPTVESTTSSFSKISLVDSDIDALISQREVEIAYLRSTDKTKINKDYRKSL